MGSLIFSIFILFVGIVGIYLLVRPVTVADDPKFSRMVSRIVGGVILGLSVLLLVPMSVKSVDATAVGIPITLGQPGQALGPGPHLTLPWTAVESLDVKTQNVTMDDDNEVKTITTDRVQTPVDVVVYFHVDSDKAPTLLLTVGDDYVEKIVKPLTRSTVYDKGSIYSAEDIQNKRDDYELSVFTALKTQLAPRGIILEGVEIKKIQLPDAILNNAQAKITAEENQKRAVIDAKTRVIEAEAQAKANKILADSVQQNKDVCQLLLVQALAKGQITGPLYVNPCGIETGTGPLITKSAG